MRGMTLVLGLGLALSGLTATQPTAAVGHAVDGPRLQLAPVPGTDLRSVDVSLDGTVLRGSGSFLATGPMSADRFSVLGLTWRGPTSPRIQVRTHGDQGWSPWQLVPLLSDGPDRGAEGPAGVRGTQPWWVGRSDAVDVRVQGPVRDLELALIDPGATPAATSTRSEQPTGANRPGKGKPKKAPRPRIKSRDASGANEKWRDGRPSLNHTIKQVHVHHTASANEYARRDVPALLRVIYRYHTHNLGWSDIGYNFLVDRFGRIWQGRAGGVGRPVRGAHTLGFNETSTGVSVLGTFTDKAPRRKVLTAIVRLAAWRLDHYKRRPAGRVKVRSHGSDKYAAGDRVRLPVIDGHRDTNDTECPGELLYAKLHSVRKRAQVRTDRYDPRR